MSREQGHERPCPGPQADKAAPGSSIKCWQWRWPSRWVATDILGAWGRGPKLSGPTWAAPDPGMRGGGGLCQSIRDHGHLLWTVCVYLCFFTWCPLSNQNLSLLFPINPLLPSESPVTVSCGHSHPFLSSFPRDPEMRPQWKDFISRCGHPSRSGEVRQGRVGTRRRQWGAHEASIPQAYKLRKPLQRGVRWAFEHWAASSRAGTSRAVDLQPSNPMKGNREASCWLAEADSIRQGPQARRGCGWLSS